jgi:hypothetical protein
MQDTFHGYLSKKKKTKERETPSQTWQLTNDAAIKFLRLITPYLKEPEKVRRATLILNEYKKLTLRNGRYNAEQRGLKLEFERRFFEEGKKPNRQTENIRW